MAPTSNGWKGFALAALVAFLVGGGGASWFSSARVDAVETELRAADKNTLNIVIEMNNRLIRIETMIEEMRRNEVP